MQLIYGSKLKEKHDEFLYVNDANLSLPFGITYFEKSMPFLDNLSYQKCMEKKEADAKKIAAKALLHFDAVDILICNAAIRPSDAFLEMTDEQWPRVINTNFMGSFWLARACLPGMVDKGWGRVINFAGMNAIHGYNGRAHVSASKHAVWGLTKALAKEFAPMGITANIISPGPIEGERNDPTMAAHIAEMVDRVPIGRLGTGDEVSSTCALLASDKGGFINGQMIQINGGAET